MIKDIYKNYCFGLKFFRGYYIAFFTYVILTALMSLLSVLEPLIYSKLISSLIIGNKKSAITCLVFILIISLTKIILQVVTSKTNNYIKREVNASVQKKITIRMLYAPVLHTKIKYSDGKLISLIGNDVSVLSEYIFYLTNFMLSICNIIVTGVVLMSINVYLTLIILLLFFALLTVNIINSRKLKQINMEMNDSHDVLVNGIKEMVHKLTDIKICNAVVCYRNKLFRLIDNFKQQHKRRFEKQLQNSVQSGVIQYFSSFIYMALGACLVLLEQIRIEQFIAFYSYSQNFSGTLFQWAKLNTELQPQNSIMDRLKKFFEDFDDCIADEKQKNNLQNKITEVEIRNIKISFDGKEVVRNVDCILRNNGLTGIIGNNGTGKTSILKVMTKQLLPAEGEVFFNNEGLPNISDEGLREHISYMAAEPLCFDLSIYENIVCGKEHDMVEIIRLSKQIGIYGDIVNLPDGFNTVLDNRIRLSSGQVRKLQLLRALLRESDILILDEPTSNIDDLSQKTIYELIMDYAKKHIVLLVTHDADMIKHCDEVYKIENGKFVKVEIDGV